MGKYICTTCNGSVLSLGEDHREGERAGFFIIQWTFGVNCWLNWKCRRGVGSSDPFVETWGEGGEADSIVKAARVESLRCGGVSHALLDGGPTHILRSARDAEEYENAVPTLVEVAAGKVTLRQVEGTGTLITDFDTQVILPLGILEFRLNTEPNFPRSINRIYTWNLTRWTPQYPSNKHKNNFISRALKKGPVLLQETKWTNEHYRHMLHTWPEIPLAHSPAISLHNGLSGGTAILLPPAWSIIETVEIVPGYVIAVKAKQAGYLVWLVSMYNSTRSTLDAKESYKYSPNHQRSTSFYRNRLQ